MNRESQSHFAGSPTLEISRSKFNRSFTHKTSFNNGELIPIYCDTTIMPGDTVKMRMSEVVRMSTPITPVMDNMNMDIFFFFVPYRLVWTHFKRFMGENDTKPWTQTTEYEIPQVYFPRRGINGVEGWQKGDLADYLGYPTKVAGSEEGETSYKDITASCLPFRAYALIWNEFFRDQNLQNPVNIEENSDSTANGITAQYSNYDPVQHICRGGGLLRVAKYHDYFTSCLPGAQKGPAVTIPLSTDKIPVRLGDVWNTSYGEGVWSSGELSGEEFAITNYHVEDNEQDTAPEEIDSQTQSIYKLYTDLSIATGATINALRQAFAIQKFYERQALGGTRYIEMIKSHFDVTNPDFRLQRPEYLGGKRIPINMNQVIQTNPTVEGSTPLGTTGAFSVTADNDDMFTHSFTEHGILLGLCCTRTVHTYQQGLNRQYSKKKFTDFYFPEFANLGNQAVLNKEIFLNNAASNNKNEEAFGYQEAWACERYFPDIVTSSMRSNYTGSLDIWHYADYYENLPSLGDKWIQEGDENVARTLAVQNEDQLIADFYFGAIYTRPMPLYSIPGLIDHH